MLLPNLLSNGFLIDNPLGIDMSDSINMDSQYRLLILIKKNEILIILKVLQTIMLVLLTFLIIRSN
jgi:hypothetical protein